MHDFIQGLCPITGLWDKAHSFTIDCLEQRAFVGGHRIFNNTLITLEFIHDLHRDPIQCCFMMIKPDMERAYDRISWWFVDDTLVDFGLLKIR